MKNHMRNFISVLTTLPVLLLLTSQIYANELPKFNADEFWFDTAGTQVDVVTPFEFESVELRVRKRGETEVWTESFGSGLSLSVDLAHVIQSGLTDDRYTYEIRFVLGSRTSDPTDQEAAGAEEPMTYSTSGTFKIQDGSITDISIPGYRSPGNSKGGTVQSNSGLEATSDGDPTPTDFSDSGDLAMGGYAVFGSSNLNNVVAGKVRIRPTGSGSDAYANLTVESNAANSDQYFWHFGTQGGDLGIQSQRTGLGGKTTVLGIEENAPASSLMITSTGRIGLGTATPANRLHIVSGETFPGIRLEHTSSGGSGGMIHDSANRLRFRINGTTRMTLDGDNFGIGTVFPTERLHVGGNARISGSVGIGVTTPAHPLHISRSNGTARVSVNENSGTTAARTLFDIRNNGATRFVIENTNAASGVWTFSVGTGSAPFVIGKVGTGVQEMVLEDGGHAYFAGNVHANGVMLTSTREAKTDFEAADENEILEKLAALDILQWRYKHEVEGTRHIGPIAEEFHEIFGFSDGKSLNMIDTNGITFAAIKALNTENERLAQQNQELARGNAELNERLDRLEAALDIR